MPKSKAKEQKAEVKAAPKKKGLVVYAPFEDFQAGDAFEIPEGWQRDEAFEQLITSKQKSREGMAFQTPKGKRVILPVKEA